MKTNGTHPKGSMQEFTTTIENKFKQGDVVYERIRPSQRLVVGHYAANLYYCKDESNPKSKALVYFERELTDSFSNLKK